jgi:hypothetical protein
VFIGHYAVALAAKRAVPRTSLGTLFAAASLADLLWPIFLLLGWERVLVTSDPNPFLTLGSDLVGTNDLAIVDQEHAYPGRGKDL